MPSYSQKFAYIHTNFSDTSTANPGSGPGIVITSSQPSLQPTQDPVLTFVTTHPPPGNSMPDTTCESLDSFMYFRNGVLSASAVWLCIGGIIYALHQRKCTFCQNHNRSRSSANPSFFRTQTPLHTAPEISKSESEKIVSAVQFSSLQRPSIVSFDDQKEPDVIDRPKAVSFDMMYANALSLNPKNSSTLSSIPVSVSAHAHATPYMEVNPSSVGTSSRFPAIGSTHAIDDTIRSADSVSLELQQWISNTDYMVAELETPSEQKAFNIQVENFENKRIDAHKIKYKQKVGSGFFGEVYRAEYFGAEVAVKQTKEITKNTVNVLLQEGKIWYGIKKHPNICRLIGYIHDEHNLGLVMDFVENGSVLDCLERGYQFTNQEKYDIIQQASAGLWHLHEDKFVHRDLALRNVLIDLEDFSVKITDFGMSRLIINVNYNKTVSRMLPIAWSAPEAILKSHYSTRSDVWSFGVLIWELLSEKMPFQGINQMQLMLEITRGTRTLKCDDSWNEKVANLLRKCWSMDPAKRPTAEDIFELVHTLTERKRIIVGISTIRSAIE